MKSFLVGALGGLIGAGGAIVAQFVNRYLTAGRERQRLKITCFERFNSQWATDSELKRIRVKSEVEE